MDYQQADSYEPNRHRVNQQVTQCPTHLLRCATCGDKNPLFAKLVTGARQPTGMKRDSMR